MNNLKQAIEKVKRNPIYLDRRIYDILSEFESLLEQMETTKEEAVSHMKKIKEESELIIENSIKSPILNAAEKLSELEDNNTNALDSFKARIDDLVSSSDKRISSLFSAIDLKLKELDNLIEKVSEMEPEKGDPGEPGESVDEEKIIQSVLSQIPPPVEKPLDGDKIARELESLPEEKKLSQSAIKGLSEQIRVILQAVREASRNGGQGGGMGNVQHEKFSINASTTSVTTAFPIAGNGYAIMGAYYNGQQIHRGEMYTVSSNLQTINLQFTPQNDSDDILTITYIRG